VITIPPNFADTNYSHGQGKVDALVTNLVPKAHLVSLLVNDVVPGGSDGFDKIAISFNGFGFGDILTHETGHVLANLGDEYDYTNLFVASTNEEPNTTRQTNSALIKWRAWIPTNTPIPTPATSPYNNTVGLFRGAHYDPTNWYRPKLDCGMRDRGVAFCEVCSEALVLAIYQRVRPIDAYLPASSSLSISNAQPINFTVSLLQPATHNLTVQWQTNGVTVSGATNASLSLDSETFANGTNLVTALVRDQTSLVRNDPSNLLSQNLTWTVNVSAPQLRLDSPQTVSGGKFAFQISGNAPLGFSIQSSTNLVNWTPVVTNSLLMGYFWYTNQSSVARQFFRARTPP